MSKNVDKYYHRDMDRDAGIEHTYQWFLEHYANARGITANVSPR